MGRVSWVLLGCLAAVCAGEEEARAPDPRVVAPFRRFDWNQDGKIDRREHNMLTQLTVPGAPPIMKHAFRVYAKSHGWDEEGLTVENLEEAAGADLPALYSAFQAGMSVPTDLAGVREALMELERKGGSLDDRTLVLSLLPEG
eukprot:Hpha_TRINITY_DN24827_c0_g1::TRINITY_DN24827_c0_g1_i1::g.97306::m.97306